MTDEPDPAPQAPATADAAAVAETHSAVVFFFGDRAYKVKKPVDLGFLDFRRRETREVVCHREVELNRRLAADVYLGVADVYDPDGQVNDHLVVMRRMPVERRLSTLITSGRPVEGDLRMLARVMTAFHAAAERSPAADRAASPEALAQRWTDSTAALEELASGSPPGTASLVGHIQDLAMRYLAGRSHLFDTRISDGRACDGHGDLLADDVFCLDDGPRVLDCIEFDDNLRYGDTLADVAFLAMDLERLGRPDLSRLFLAAYQEHADDTWPSSLAHHHIAYRAHVRAKVAAIKAAQAGSESAALSGAAADLLRLTQQHLEAARVRLVLVGGLPGTGKSTLAAGLGDALDATVLRSDEIRKELAGMASGQAAGSAFGEGIYSPQHTAATYETMLSWARSAVSMGETVVLDASWTDHLWRDRAHELARQQAAELVELRCDAPADVAATRIRQREPGDPSDATPEIATSMASASDPWPSAFTLDTTGERGTVLDAALRHIASQA